ncbi:type IV pilus twitching motility protein PilT [Patescibacteria group bacterium]|nr:type IV pilus twitching motility protein PilT [Patescibacteria group bacterium]MBU1500303.1 type IV pilus twitching motility protein PilT [Patescibacteria group bacterium]
MLNIKELLTMTIAKKASDLHLVVGTPAYLRVDGKLAAVSEEVITAASAKDLIFPLLSPEQKDKFLVNKELDLSVAFGELGRFRVNVYFQKGTIAAELRLIGDKIKSIEELNLPKICIELAELRHGFVLVTGPTGTGKSTTLAAIINRINQNRAEHILTIEDPIEYIYKPIKSIISQREMHGDTHGWTVALRAALREDPDVVLVGEMRDYETIAAALTVAETGHLVFATLHTNSAAQTIDRIVDVFPEHQQGQVRMQLSSTLSAVISQRLIPAIGSGRVAAMEILLGTNAVKTSIREGKSHLINNVIQTSGDLGMRSLEQDLANLVNTGKVDLKTAQEYCLNPNDLLRLVKGR